MQDVKDLSGFVGKNFLYYNFTGIDSSTQSAHGREFPIPGTNQVQRCLDVSDRMRTGDFKWT